MYHDNNRKIKETEYDQLSEDWRYRDAQMWKSLAFATAISGGAALLVFGKDSCDSLEIKLFVLITIAFHNFLLLMKLSKDRFYQYGSGELLLKFGQRKLIEDFNLSENNPGRLVLRIYKPKDDDGTIPLKLLQKTIYKRLIKLNTYNWIYLFHAFLIIIPIVLIYPTVRDHNIKEDKCLLEEKKKLNTIQSNNDALSKNLSDINNQILSLKNDIINKVTPELNGIHNELKENKFNKKSKKEN